MAVVDMFADLGLIAAEEDNLRDGLAVLALRLDLAGAGELLTELTELTCWAIQHGGAGCRCKGDPNPKPIQPPKPPDPKPGK